MASSQLFPPTANTVARMSLLGFVVLVALVAWLWASAARSSYVTGEGLARQQPVHFTHQHHVGDDGIDCRYCHTSVENSSFAGIPATSICMNCHQQIWSYSGMLQPVHESWRTGLPILWTRVNDLPDFVYFEHSIHVRKGVGCSSCHGRMDEMPLTWQATSLQMQWCLDCHRQPERHLRPLSRIYDMEWRPPADQLARGRQLLREYNTPSVALLMSCTTCHR
jgi:hypothetical protein